eukprot:TRINITY_DN1387_c0_g1_i3.p1 TRINITY_DN1387_c0_g1~~TRINITY_DN1387_c0_g1_i3.p1  ORF type:complete len:254 (-),score=37.65 TRINITY_DN1387_c0_g1_i3:232-993(-)
MATEKNETTELDLSFKRLTSISPAIFNQTKLRVLNLNDNTIKTVPDEIQNLTNLAGLYLSRNQVAVIGKGLGNLKSLRSLNLNNNSIVSLPLDVWVGLNGLINLGLSNNLLKNQGIPTTFSHLTSLVTLYLDHNQLSVFPPAINSLQTLSLSTNLIESIPPTLSSFQSLTLLNLSHNKLSGILSDDVWTLPNLTWFSIIGNSVVSLWSGDDGIQSIYGEKILSKDWKLEELYLDKNLLQSLPSFFVRVNKLYF